jgi:hypothetical protein
MSMSTWKLFLDDEREPVGTGWTVCRSVAEVEAVAEIFGLPSFISFDHDLGDGPAPVGYDNTGMGLAKWIADRAMDGAPLPEDFQFFVHSQNPIGADNIRQFMRKFLDFHKKEHLRSMG